MVAVMSEAVVADTAVAIGGGWSPAAEPDPGRRARLIACARLALYAPSRGLRLTALGTSLVAARDDSWLMSAVEDLDEVSDGPGDADIDALAGIYMDDAVGGKEARELARCILDDAVGALITSSKHDLRHSRDGDLPARLLLLEPEAAVGQLDLAPGERPRDLPAMLSPEMEWWVP